MSWKLHWHYLATTVCVLESRTIEHPHGIKDVSSELCKKLAGDYNLVKAILAGRRTKDGDPLFMETLRSCLPGLKLGLTWEPGDLQDLDVQFRRIPGHSSQQLNQSREYVLIPAPGNGADRAVLYIPWPLFPAGENRECRAAIWGHAAEAEVEIPVLDLDQFTAGNDHYLFVRATLDAADALLYCDTIQLPTPRRDPKAAIEAEADRQGRKYPIGRFTSRSSMNVEKRHTYVDISPSTLELVLGLDDNKSELSDDDTTILVAAWPCGALTGKDRGTRDCPPTVEEPDEGMA